MLKENLVMLRRIHGFSQEEISEKIGISRQAYAKWESGATIPDIEKCSLLAEVRHYHRRSHQDRHRRWNRHCTAAAERKKYLGLCCHQ